MALTTTNKPYQRLALQVSENTDGTIENWRLTDRRSGKVLIYRGGRDMLDVMRRFFKYERVEAILCAEIDREFPNGESEE